MPPSVPESCGLSTVVVVVVHAMMAPETAVMEKSPKALYESSWAFLCHRADAKSSGLETRALFIVSPRAA